MFLKLAWLPPDTEFLGVKQRPLSLGSMQASRLMGLRSLDAEMEPAEQYRQMRAWLWLHREPVDDVAQAIWSGSWLSLLEDAVPDPLPVELLEKWAVQRERIHSLLTASEITIRPRPAAPSDEHTPFEVVGPDETAFRLATVARATGASLAWLMWEMPLYQLRQIYHAELRWGRFWTVRPAGEAVAEQAFEGFGDAVLGNLAE